MESNKRIIRSFYIERAIMTINELCDNIKKSIPAAQLEVMMPAVEKLQPLFTKAFAEMETETFDIVFDEAKDPSATLYVESFYQFILANIDQTMKQMSMSNEIFLKSKRATDIKTANEMNMVGSLAAHIANNIATIMSKVSDLLMHHVKKNGWKTLDQVEGIVSKNYFFVDVETMGFHGHTFAFGYVLADPMGNVLDEGHSYFMPEDVNHADYEWVKENILCHYPEDNTEGRLSFPENAMLTEKMKTLATVFRDVLDKHQVLQNCYVVADCPFPCETNFFQTCNVYPYPIVDVASMLLMVGKDPKACYTREEGEMRVHHPLDDARQTKRMFFALVNGKIDSLVYKYPAEEDSEEICDDNIDE